MKKLLLLSLSAGALIPGLVFAAYNDVSLTSGAVLSVNGISLNVAGSASVVASITVDTTNFTVSLEPGSMFKVNAPNGNDLAASPAISSAFYTCTATEATLEYKDVTVTQTITITPSAATCTAGRSSSGGTASSDSGGGATPSTAVAAPIAATPTIESLQAQLQALLTQLSALQGTPAPAPAAAKGLITAYFASGSRGPGVKALQQFFNTHGFVIANSGPGSPGNETENFGGLTVKAVQKFQEKYGIAKPGEPGYGRVGPKTRAKINELSGN